MTRPRPRAPDGFGHRRRDPAQGAPESVTKLVRGRKSEYSDRGNDRSDRAMRIFTGWAVAAGFILAMTTANAQVLAPEVLAPEVLAPEVSVPQVVVPQVSVPQVSVPQVSVPQVSASREAPRNGPILLPAPEVYSILR